MSKLIAVLFTTLLVITLVGVVSAVPVVELITESGYWTCPTNVFVAQIAVTGGGGGGLGGNATHVGYAGHN